MRTRIGKPYQQIVAAERGVFARSFNAHNNNKVVTYDEYDNFLSARNQNRVYSFTENRLGYALIGDRGVARVVRRENG